MRVDGQIKGIGGYYYNTDGCRVAFVEAPEDNCKRYRLALAKAVKRFFAEIDAAGITRLDASADLARAASPRWLERLGFHEVARTEKKAIYQWRR